jgi:hypothetical protein
VPNVYVRDCAYARLGMPFPPPTSTGARYHSLYMKERFFCVPKCMCEIVRMHV